MHLAALVVKYLTQSYIFMYYRIGSFHTGSRQKVALNLPVHSSATASLHGRVSTSTSCFHFRKELTFVMRELKYSANDRRKDFRINRNECDLDDVTSIYGINNSN
jgi:hypothetical protein